MDHQATESSYAPRDTTRYVHNPVSVRVNDSVGSIFLGLMALILLLALLRSQAQNRKLLQRLQQGL